MPRHYSDFDVLRPLQRDQEPSRTSSAGATSPCAVRRNGEPGRASFDLIGRPRRPARTAPVRDQPQRLERDLTVPVRQLHRHVQNSARSVAGRSQDGGWAVQVSNAAAKAATAGLSNKKPMWVDGTTTPTIAGRRTPLGVGAGRPASSCACASRNARRWVQLRCRARRFGVVRPMGHGRSWPKIGVNRYRLGDSLGWASCGPSLAPGASPGRCLQASPHPADPISRKVHREKTASGALQASGRQSTASPPYWRLPLSLGKVVSPLIEHVAVTHAFHIDRCTSSSSCCPENCLTVRSPPGRRRVEGPRATRRLRPRRLRRKQSRGDSQNELVQRPLVATSPEELVGHVSRPAGRHSERSGSVARPTQPGCSAHGRYWLHVLPYTSPWGRRRSHGPSRRTQLGVLEQQRSHPRLPPPHPMSVTLRDGTGNRG